MKQQKKIYLFSFVLQADAAKAYDMLAESCGGGQIDREVNGRHTGYNFESDEAWTAAREEEMQARDLTESDEDVKTSDAMITHIEALLRKKGLNPPRRLFHAA